MSESSTKTRRSAAEKAQDALDAAEETLRTKKNVVARLTEELSQAERRLKEAQDERDYRFSHPALRSTPVDPEA